MGRRSFQWGALDNSRLGCILGANVALVYCRFVHLLPRAIQSEIVMCVKTRSIRKEYL